ncbi:MAG: hypothetical protein PG981_001443 [Wolbachia endosymbiont of Ctenocephalides orientis wCori]|nr:MAG: hypothetical protein PG981_001443 [Wolbachia endosymbiont of Ctenocephalides orientis wCori]
MTTFEINGFPMERVDTGCPEMVRKIRERRLIRGLTQNNLGEKIGVTFQQIQKYEWGRNSVPVNRLCDIAKALSVDIMDLFPRLFCITKL